MVVRYLIWNDLLLWNEKIYGYFSLNFLLWNLKQLNELFFGDLLFRKVGKNLIQYDSSDKFVFKLLDGCTKKKLIEFLLVQSARNIFIALIKQLQRIVIDDKLLQFFKTYSDDCVFPLFFLLRFHFVLHDSSFLLFLQELR